MSLKVAVQVSKVVKNKLEVRSALEYKNGKSMVQL